MQEELLKKARECRFFRGALLELAAELPPDDEALDQLVAEAVAKRENDAFVRIVFAALGAGRRIDARHLEDGASLFDDPQQLAAAAWHLSGDVPQALTRAVQHEHLSTEREGTALLLAGLWCKKNRNVPVPPELIVQARIQARRAGHNVLGDFQIALLANLLEDAGLLEILDSNGIPPPTSALADNFISGMIDPVKESASDIVPDRPDPVVRSGYTVRRAVARIGRNDPCPCGSGKKYKKCCMEKDEERLQESSSVPGLTLTEFREQRERFLNADELLQMRSHELVRLDPIKVAAPLRPLLINRLHLFGELEAAVQLFEKTGVPEDLRGHWLDCVHEVVRTQQKDLLVRLMKLQDPSEYDHKDFPFAARLLLAEESRVLEIVEEAALAGLHDPQDESSIAMAFGLLEGRWPALGILVSRGMVAHVRLLDAETLLDSLLETRDKLNLPPNDPLQAVLDQRFELSIEEHRDSEALQDAHARLEIKNHELSQARSRLTQLQAELARRESNPKARPAAVDFMAAAPRPAPDAAAVDELRRRVASLREELKERHNERNQLRGELKEALELVEKLHKEETAATEPDETESIEERLLDEPQPMRTQPVRIPEFSQKFQESLKEIPLKTVRHAMSTIGRLAAGENSAFAGIKRLKANRDIFRQRIGADYRLLFRLHAKTIELLTLIPRRDLERKIRTLTAS